MPLEGRGGGGGGGGEREREEIKCNPDFTLKYVHINLYTN